MKEVALSGKYSHLKCILDDGWAQMLEDGGISIVKNAQGYACVNNFFNKNPIQERIHMIIMDHKYNTRLVVDHINENKLDNRVENLRLVGRSVNGLNTTKPSKNNKLGILGLTWLPKYKRYAVELSINRKRVYRSYFKNFEEAKLVAEFNNEIKKL